MTFASLWQIHNILQNSAKQWRHRVTWEPPWLSDMAQLAQVSFTFWLLFRFFIYLSIYFPFFLILFLSSSLFMTGCWSHTRQFKNKFLGTRTSSLVVQWVRIHLAKEGTWFQFLVGKPISHMPRGNQARPLQLLKRMCFGGHEPQLEDRSPIRKDLTWYNKDPVCHIRL